MTRLPIADLLAGTRGTLISSAVGPRSFDGVSTDSRTLARGQVFFAIRGEKHDGHDYLRQAAAAGAALAVVDRDMPPDRAKLARIPLIVVEDTLRALQSLAALWRSRHPVPLVAVVGSVGKTTTKDMTAAILSMEGPCLKNPGNLNNHIGLPLSLLMLGDEHRYAVLEMGSNAPGEIAFLSSVARPTAGILTRLGWAHLEGFGGHGGLVEEKGSVLDGINADGWCALNADDAAFPTLARRARCRVIPYGFGTGEVRASGVAAEGGETNFLLEGPMGRGVVRLKAFGRHFVENALAAVAGTLPLNVPLEKVLAALTAWRPLAGRGGIFTPRPGVTFIDDTYNANPLAVEAALETLALARRQGVAVAVLGEMLELGAAYEEGHLGIGRRAAELGIDYLLAVGPAASLVARGAMEAGMPPDRVRECPDAGHAASALSPLLVPGVWVLFKGSRGSRMEKVMEPFLEGRALAAGEA